MYAALNRHPLLVLGIIGIVYLAAGSVLRHSAKLSDDRFVVESARPQEPIRAHSLSSQVGLLKAKLVEECYESNTTRNENNDLRRQIELLGTEDERSWAERYQQLEHELAMANEQIKQVAKERDEFKSESERLRSLRPLLAHYQAKEAAAMQNIPSSSIGQ